MNKNCSEYLYIFIMYIMRVNRSVENKKVKMLIRKYVVLKYWFWENIWFFRCFIGLKGCYR